jgi:hypothetical protein
MKRVTSPVGAAVLAAVGVLAFGRVAPAQSESNRISIPIGAARVELSHAQVTNDFDIRAFIATDSLNPNCLVTMAESNFAVPGVSIFCAPRILDGQRGVLVSAFYPSPPPPDLGLTITLYQESAHGYAAPVLYLGQ